MIKTILFSAFFIFLNLPVFADGFSGIPTDSMLGSEISWRNFGGTLKMGVSVAAGKKRALMIGIKQDKTMIYRTSADYSRPFAFPPGCRGNDCWNTYAPYMKEWSDWSEWKVASGSTYSPFVTPKLATDSTGTIYIATANVSTIPNGEDQVILSMLPITFRPPAGGENTNQDTVVSSNTVSLVEAGAKKIIDLELSFLGNTDGQNFDQLVLGVYRQDLSFNLYERFYNYRNSRFEWRHSAWPADLLPNSTERPRFRTFGKGNRFLAVIIKQNDGLKVITYEKDIDNSLPLKLLAAQVVPNTAQHHSLDLEVLPGGLTLLAYQEASGQLAMSAGLWANNRFGFVLARNPGPIQYRYGDFKIVKHFNEYFIVAQEMNGGARLLRWDTYSPQQKWINVGHLPLNDSMSTPAKISITQVDKELYVAHTKNNGDVVWANLLRAATQQYTDSKRVFIHTNPAHRGPVYANGAYSDMGLAFFAVPEDYLELFVLQPGSRCHPGGWPTPLVCGKVFVDFDDYWGVPIIPAPSVPRYSVLTDALNVLNDGDANTVWPINWLKAFRGAVALKSGIKAPDLIFHEWMHEVDFDVVNGDLIPAVRDRFQSRVNTIIGNRQNALPDDGQRSVGYVSDYAESNTAEDWADSAAYYRFKGDTFRHLMDVDKRLGSTRIQDKYNILKEFFKGKEFNDQGTLNLSSKLRPLVAYFNNRRPDVHTISTPDAEADIIRKGYYDYRNAGHIYLSSGPLRSELELWWNEGRNDFFSTATREGKEAARAAGYIKIRSEGFVFNAGGEGRVALKLYWNSERNDNALIAEDVEDENVLRANGYSFVRIEGFAKTSADGELTRPLTVLAKANPKSDFATTSSLEQKISMQKFMPWRRQGYVWKELFEGAVELELYQNPRTNDYTLATRGSSFESRIIGEGYTRIRTEGFISKTRSFEASVPLTIFSNSRTGDYATIAERESITWALNEGYRQETTLGYISLAPY